MDNKKEKSLQQQQNNIAAQAQSDREQLMLHYESYRGSWRIDEAYKEDSESSRKVFSFADDGRLLIRGEAGDFFVGEIRGTLCGEWEIIGEDSIKISYENAESNLADVYFGTGGLANVELSEDGSSITFYVDAVNGSKFTLKKYPGTE